MVEPTQDAPAVDPGQGPQQPGAAPQQPASGGPDGPKPQDPAPETVSRAEMEKVVGERQAAKERARKAEELSTELQKELGTMPLAEELDAFRKWNDDKNARAREKAIKDGDVEAIEKGVREPLQGKLAEKDQVIDRQGAQLKNILCDQALRKAAESANAHNPDQVVSLLRHRVKMEPADNGEFRPQFLAVSGVPACDDNGERITDAEGFVGQYLQLPENANLVKSSAKPGSGAAPAGGQVDPNRIPATLEEFNALPPEKKVEVSQKMTSAQRRDLAGVSKSADPGSLLT